MAKRNVGREVLENVGQSQTLRSLGVAPAVVRDTASAVIDGGQSPDISDLAVLQHDEQIDSAAIRSVRETTCVVVGGGPAGMMLGLLLARQSVPVIVLEAFKDFDRDFRGESVQPSVLEILNQLGFIEEFQQLPHQKVQRYNFVGSDGEDNIVDYTRLKTKFPYVTCMIQTPFLEFLNKKAHEFPSFSMVMGARVEKLIEENGEIRGVQYRADDGFHEVRSTLVVAADGRFSRVRRLANMEAKPLKGSQRDILWFLMPGTPNDDLNYRSFSRIHEDGRYLSAFRRAEDWRVGYWFAKGEYHKIREQGFDKFKEMVAELMPEFNDRLHALRSWKDTSLLPSEVSFVERWHRPGLLLIGDAAHVMGAIGGVGVNLAIQDAVATAYILAKPLRDGTLSERDLAQVQKERAPSARFIQRTQTRIERVFTMTLEERKKRRRWVSKLVHFIRNLRPVNDLVVYLFSFGFRPPRVAKLETPS